MKTLRPLSLGVILVLLALAAPRVFATHIPEDEILTFYLELNVPVCNYAPENKVMELDCLTPIPAAFECWKAEIHMDYDTAMLTEFFAETQLSNQRYQYFNEPYYNELYSNRNWDNLMDYSDKC